MKSTHKKRVLLSVLVCLILVTGFGFLFAEDFTGSGILVESVTAGEIADQAGVKEGDLLLSWVRLSNPPANPQIATGSFHSPWDFEQMLIEEAPRGSVLLTALRDGKGIDYLLPHGPWGLEISPALSGEELAQYGEALKMHDEGRFDEYAASLLKLREAPGAFSRPSAACWVLKEASDLFLKDKEYERALTHSNEALAIAREHHLVEAQSTLLSGRGMILIRQKEYDKAEQALTETLDFRKEHFGESLSLAGIYNTQAYLAYQRKDYEESEILRNKGLRIREKLAPDTLLVASSLHTLADLAEKRRDRKAARALYERALEIREKLAPGDPVTARTLNNLGNLLRRQGDIDIATEYQLRALKIRKDRLPGSLDLSASYNNLGILARGRGDLDKAEEYHLGALKIREKLAPGTIYPFQSLNNLGIVAHNRGDLTLAESYHKKALGVISKLDPGSTNQGASFNNLGIIAEDRGNYLKAEEYHRRVLNIEEKISPESIRTANSLLNLGNVAMAQFNYDTAEELFLRSLSILEKTAPRNRKNAYILNSLGNLSLKRGEFDKAEEYHLKGLAFKRKFTPESLSVANSLENLGMVALKLGEQGRAESYHREALAIYQKKSPGGIGIASCLSNLGGLSEKKGDRAEAISLHTKALAIYRILSPGSASLAESLFSLGKLHLRMEEPERALDLFTESVEALESQKGKLGGGEESQVEFSARYADYYRELVQLLVRLDKPEAAFHTIERYRARSLLHMLAQRDLDFTLDAPEALIRKQKELSLAYSSVLKYLSWESSQENGKKVSDYHSQLKTISRQQKELEEEIKRAAPQLARLTSPEPLNLKQFMTGLEPGTLFLSYSTAAKSTVLFAITNDSYRVYSLPEVRRDLEPEIMIYRKLLMTPLTGTEILHILGRQLYVKLLRPAEKMIAKADRIVISPDGPLHYLPFSTLRNREGYLAETIPSSTILSATLYTEINSQKRRAPSERIRFAAFGNPVLTSSNSVGESVSPFRSSLRLERLKPLPATKYEIDGIRKLYPDSVQAYLGKDATENLARKISRETEVIHFATHGILDEHYPLNSGLVLSLPENPGDERNNGILQAWEVFEEVRIDADLVVLSACETGLGKEMGGEGLIGLTRAFQYAGAKTVLSSLWSVADGTTAELMKMFYLYRKQGKPGDEALRMAQIGFIRSPVQVPAGEQAEIDASHPFYWAPFVLNGRWR